MLTPTKFKHQLTDVWPGLDMLVIRERVYIYDVASPQVVVSFSKHEESLSRVLALFVSLPWAGGKAGLTSFFMRVYEVRDQAPELLKPCNLRGWTEVEKRAYAARMRARLP